MGARRDDISASQRAQIAIEALSPYRLQGTISRLARQNSVSRQAIYDIAAAGKAVLETYLAPGPHGPQPPETTLRVDRERLVRGSVKLTEAGVSQRDVSECLAELLDTRVSPSWVNAELAHQEAAAAVVNAGWPPSIGESLSGDEIYSNGWPNLMLVGNASLYVYALTRQPTCDGETWACVLLDAPECPQFASDAGTGLAAGAKLAQIQVHQIDWDHVLRPLWGQAARLEERAYAALQAVEDRAAKFELAHTPQRLVQHLATWERLRAEAQDKLERADAFQQIAQQVDAEFALIDLQTGQLRDPAAGAERLRGLGRQLQQWTGGIYEKLSGYLLNWADQLFGYQPVLAHALTPLVERWGAPVIQALSRMWQIEAEGQRHPLPLVERQARQAQWEQSLDETSAVLNLEQLGVAWEALTQVLGRSWRGSMLVECVNSLLRPRLNSRKHTDQGCLELFRFLHNVHVFQRGKRAGHSPAQLVGLEVPDDPLTLLGLPAKVSI
jgi:hypothetical protein